MTVYVHCIYNPTVVIIPFKNSIPFPVSASWSGSPPKSHRLLPVTHPVLPVAHQSSSSTLWVILWIDRQTNRLRQKKHCVFAWST